MPNVDFFATTEDLLETLLSLERRRPLAYVLRKYSLQPEITTYSSATSIPDLGIEEHPRPDSGRMFLIVDASIPLAPVEHPGGEGRIVYGLNHWDLPQAVDMQPGGIYRGDPSCLLLGNAGCGLVDPVAASLFHALKRALIRDAVPVKTYGHAIYVCPHAVERARQGARLVIRPPDTLLPFPG
jgi:hypothetical protein